MSESERFLLADGLTAVIPEGWEYCCESERDLVVEAIGMRSGTCDANLELLNHFAVEPENFISTYRFKIMTELVNLGFSFQNHESKHSDEIVAIERGTNRLVYHSFLSTSPIVHISAVSREVGDLIDLRKIRSSIRIDQLKFDSSDEDLIRIKLSEFWRPKTVPSGTDV